MFGLFKRKKVQQPHEEPLFDDRVSYREEFESTEQNAVVKDLRCYVETVGIKHPKTVKRFLVVFETDTGEILSLPVNEEQYEGFEIGQQGLLTIVEGELYGFAI